MMLHSSKLLPNLQPDLNLELELDGLNFQTADTGAISLMLLLASQTLIHHLMTNHLVTISHLEMILPTLSLLLARAQSQAVDQPSVLTQSPQFLEVGLLDLSPPSTIQSGRPQL